MLTEGQGQERELAAQAERLVLALRELGYQAEHLRPSVISSATSGFPFIIATTTGGWLQFGLTVKNGQHRIGLEEINTYNKSYRFARLYLDDDFDAVLTADLRIPPDSDAATFVKTLQMCLQIWDEVIGLLINLLRAHMVGPREPSSDAAAAAVGGRAQA